MFCQVRCVNFFLKEDGDRCGFVPPVAQTLGRSVMTSLNFSFFICNIGGNNIYQHKVVVRIKWNNIWESTLGSLMCNINLGSWVGLGRGSNAELKGPCAQSYCPPPPAPPCSSVLGPGFPHLLNGDQQRSKGCTGHLRS